MLLPLSDLCDPVSFLKGARVPLHDTSSYPMRREWCVDTCVLRLVSDEAWVACGLTPRLALDLSDPDVARWCDRKIAAAYGFPEVIAAVLCIFDGQWCVHLMGVAYPSSVDARFDAAFEGIPCDAANIPTARAALLRALFGKETP